MGYEILFKYHPQLDDGNYDREQVKELKKKVGDPYDDIPLEKVAKIVMSQRARRDILIFDAEIYEYKKTKINFKETKGGIVIKHKKFLLDDESNIIVQEIEESVTTPPMSMPTGPAHHNNGAMVPVQPPNNKVNIAVATRPIKFVVLDPDPQTQARVKQKGLSFLPNKRYPVFAEIPGTKFGTTVYTILDENKRQVNVLEEYFVNADQRMLQGFSSAVDANESLGHGGLVGGYESSDNIPNIR